jgi:hypothetical protein
VLSASRREGIGGVGPLTRVPEREERVVVTDPAAAAVGLRREPYA